MNHLRIGYAFAGGVLGYSVMAPYEWGIAIGGFAIALTAALEYALFRLTGSAPKFGELEHIAIPSEEAYDYADGLPGGQTVIEDKRTAECYVAEYRGGRHGA